MQGIDSVTMKAITAGLDAASLRQQVLASNIADNGRDGSVARRVRFDAAWSEAAGGVQLRARIEPDRLGDGSTRPVELDDQVAALSRNTLHYQALVRGLNRWLSVLASAASEGKR